MTLTRTITVEGDDVILITGNLGYIGPVVACHLRKIHPDAELIGLDSGFFADCKTADPAESDHVIDRSTSATCAIFRPSA